MIRWKRTELDPEPQTPINSCVPKGALISGVPPLSLYNLQIYSSVREAQASPYTLIEYGRKIIGAVVSSWQKI